LPSESTHSWASTVPMCPTTVKVCFMVSILLWFWATTRNTGPRNVGSGN